jgi:exodeoxyribonuclease V beta subunit
MAENLRLLYGAITRAEHRCYLAWGHVSQGGSSPIAWLLHPSDGAESVSQMRERVKNEGDGGLRRRLEDFSRGMEGRVSVQPLLWEERQVSPVPGEPSVLEQARVFHGRIESKNRITSFSALASANHGDAERPDHDADDKGVSRPEPGTVRRDIFTFPRGSRAGSCLHQIFEQLDFADHTVVRRDQLVVETLDAFGFDPEWSATISTMVERVLATPLDSSGLTLKSVTSERRLVEMEFHYPLTALHDKALRRLLEQQPRYSGEPFQPALERIRFSEVSGFMRGFIDLVFEANGRFYLLDYKSNWLGDGLEAYAEEHLPAVIARDAYYLQYLFYTVALHRYLQQRIHDYDYERHFGGLFYLFLRGMNPTAGSGYGIYRDRPERGLVDALDRLLDEGAPE